MTPGTTGRAKQSKTTAKSNRPKKARTAAAHKPDEDPGPYGTEKINGATTPYLCAKTASAVPDLASWYELVSIDPYHGGLV